MHWGEFQTYDGGFPDRDDPQGPQRLDAAAHPRRHHLWPNELPMLMSRRFDPTSGIGRSVQTSVNRQKPQQRANTNWEELEMDQEKKKEEGGFTLIELLVAIVVVGILTAVAIVGIGGLTGTAKVATCQATLDASRASVASYYASQSPNAYPATFGAMVTAGDLTLQGGVLNPGGGATLTDNGNPVTWTITLGAGGALSAAGNAQVLATCT
jgi:prepilin-type N-terminal cleavage/methylation domain-containing protein